MEKRASLKSASYLLKVEEQDDGFVFSQTKRTNGLGASQKFEKLEDAMNRMDEVAKKIGIYD